MEHISLVEEEVLEVLLHRDAHFGGQFSVMQDYYEKEGKGAHFEAREVDKVCEMERVAGENLAPLLFSEGEMKSVAKVRSLYEGLRELCEQEATKNPHPKLIAELILAEEDEETEALQAVATAGEKIVPELIKLATHEEFADPLFPGYGQAPLLAIKALEKIGDKRAIVPLFELIGCENVEMEEAALSTLASLKQHAEPFLLNILEARPITQDTERAVVALTSFPESGEIRQACDALLKEEGVPQVLAQYLQAQSSASAHS